MAKQETAENPERLDYRFMLKKELERRQQDNRTYSLRAFARALDVSPPYLSQLLSHKRHISEEMGRLFLKRLKWTRAQKALFVNLIRFQKVSDEAERTRLLNEIQSSKELDFLQLRQDQFQLIAEWQHFAIVELVSIKGFQSDSVWIAKRLGLRPDQANEAIERLVRVGLLQWHGAKLKKSQNYFRAGGVPSEAVRRFHDQHLFNARKALHRDQFSQRDFSGTTLAINRRHLPEMAELIREFRDRLNRFCVEHEEPDSVYQLSVQLFRLDKEFL